MGLLTYIKMILVILLIAVSISVYFFPIKRQAPTRYVGLFTYEGKRVDIFTASTGKRTLVKVEDTQPPSPEENYDAFYKYINKESDQSKEHKRRAKQLNDRSPNSFGFFGTYNDYESSLGVKFKRRF